MTAAASGKTQPATDHNRPCNGGCPWPPGRAADGVASFLPAIAPIEPAGVQRWLFNKMW